MSARVSNIPAHVDSDKLLQGPHHDEPEPVARPEASASAHARDDGPSPAAPPVARNARDWPEPDMSLLGGPRQLPAFPLDVLPPPWRDWSGNAAQRANAPLDYVGSSALGCAVDILRVRALPLVPRELAPLATPVARRGRPGAVTASGRPWQALPQR